jgi:hypothetical protein
MRQPYPSSGQPVERPRPPAPTPILTAVRLMYAGAAVSTVPLIIALAFIGDIKAYHLRYLGHSLTAAQVSHLRPLIITLVTLFGLVVPVLWLWMARANRQGWNWARILSTVLLGLATLQLAGSGGGVQVFIAALTWLTGLAAVWLLWRPASSAFFKPHGG